MRTLVVIPARYASTRFPGKPLSMLGGRPIVEHVWRSAVSAVGVDNVVVATDDSRIAECVDKAAGRKVAVMTAATHRSGTDRCGEVVGRMLDAGEAFDVVVNLQGDEPFVRQCDIETLTACFSNPEVQIATMRRRIENADDLFSPNCVKVVCGADGQALYFSRQPIPYRRDAPMDQWLDGGEYYKHIGMYAFRAEVLLKLCRLPQSMLETSEKLEQLRWLEAGYRIAVADTDYEGIGIDTPGDLERAEAFFDTQMIDNKTKITTRI